MYVCMLTAYACVCVRIDLCVYVWCGIGMHGSVCVQYAMCSHVCVCVCAYLWLVVASNQSFYRQFAGYGKGVGHHKVDQ